ncbi:hypothetical protein GA0074695_0775 [Micromonospora viridifaciens]|uniref:Uncharacterized protein n=1 Tax=Micromonospora viridifaciens TaxID=1881 RepID=A0A1C4USB9_MICVI|nr:protealysin inhibitor emfourin [Micromonospora viridifaciens]SCE74544.1 hypothetical protein GA0074695_0775 [Micromonospora viridifaciens]
MRTALVAAVALAAFLVPLAACAQTGGTGATPASVPTTTPASTPTTAPATDGTEPARKPGVEVVLTKSGGFAGLNDTVTVTADGHWTKVDREGATRSGQLAPAELDRLRQLTADRRLLAEATATAAATDCADAFTYQLTVGAVTTGYVDCSPEHAPPAVTAAVVELLTQATD